ncbi:DUF2140 domain-containing protein [Bacillus sp. V3-13]|uniref:YpmS family protein n=1 Tax=Bacillus sp. V3-13 TaxID=2053728 RepID=UPI000C75771D|nr:YpmS family protein [Bacillus sp. V3-13]PLR77253.1 DUF2140 domain-containing protein [Bacillus sp. V3-13]
MKNKWRTLFLLLAGVNIAVIAVLLIMINLPAGDRPDSLREPADQEDVQFNIKTNKHDLNRVINHYLESEGLTGTADYEVVLHDEVVLYGTLPVFTDEIKMKLTFEPEALENGDLLLRQESISVGQLQLPVAFVLKLINDRYELPEWVEISPKEELVYVSLQNMRLKSNIKVKVNEFDLRNDNIQFTLSVPVK